MRGSSSRVLRFDGSSAPLSLAQPCVGRGIRQRRNVEHTADLFGYPTLGCKDCQRATFRVPKDRVISSLLGLCEKLATMTLNVQFGIRPRRHFWDVLYGDFAGKTSTP